MATETKVSFPTIPVGHFMTLRGQFKKSIPTTISSNYLATILNMTEGAANANILPGLKQIKLVDNDGKVNSERAKKFRDDEQYSSFCKEVMTESYPNELLETFPELPNDKSGIKRWFMNHSGVGDNAAGKFASMFALLLEANPNNVSDAKPSTNGTKPKEVKAKAKVSPIVEAKTTVVQTEVEQPKHNSSHANQIHSNNPEVHVNVQVHISSDASNEQIEKIFESMGKHLFNRK